MNYVGIRAFSGPYFCVYGQNRIRIVQYIADFVYIEENKETTLSLYRKIHIRESPEFGVYQTMTSI